jgi:curved DNA-binding protein
MEKKDYYEILGIKPDANQQEVKEAYRKLALACHPDRNPGKPDAIHRMKDLNEAYAVLSDKNKRQEYNTVRNDYGASAYGRFREMRSEKEIFKGSDVSQIFEEICRNFGFRGADEVFREFYGPGARQFGFRIKGRETPGNQVKFRIGNLFGNIIPVKGKDISDTITISPLLALKGGKIRYIHTRRSKEILVVIPPGIRPGQQIRLRGMGDVGRGGGEPGDLLISVRVSTRLLERIKEWLGRFRKG